MKKHILLVEDNKRLRTNLLFVLNKEGFDATGATNGAEALAHMQTTMPDLVISDIMMPDMDGYDFVKRLRESGNTSSLPVIFLTAKTSAEELRTGMRHGADDYLTKPVNIDDLLATIRVRLERAENEKKKWMNNLQHLQLHLASVLPHELRTPVSGILGAASFLNADLDALSRADILELHQCIEASARRLARITENFLLYVQLQILLEERTLQRAETDDIGKKYHRTNDAMEHAAEVARLCAEKHNRASDLRFHITVDTAVRCSLAHFDKAMYEIIDNAFQCSPKGSLVTISGEAVGDMLFVRVSDEGRGMSNEQITFLLELPTMFKQFDRKKYEQQGLGMGLALVSSIVQLYDGNFSVESHLHKGSTVSVGFHRIVSS